MPINKIVRYSERGLGISFSSISILNPGCVPKNKATQNVQKAPIYIR